jgi:hypothetical protein
MKGVNFCSPDHRDLYLKTLDSAILARLGHKRTGLPSFVRRPRVASSQPVTALIVASAQASS